MPHVHRLFSFGVLTLGMCVVTASMGQEDESNPARAKQFDAARAQMKEIGKAIRENVKGFRGFEAQPRKKSGAEIEAFNAAIEKLHAQLDRPYAKIEKLHEDIQSQYQRAMEGYQHAMEENRDAMEKDEDSNDATAEAREDAADVPAPHGEPLPQNVELKQGDELVALRDAELKRGRETVGKVRQGERFVVDQLKDHWVSVRSGQTSGWIDSQSLMGAKLFDWYQRLPENTSVTLSGQTRAKFDGVLFEIQNAGTGPAFMAGRNDVTTTK